MDGFYAIWPSLALVAFAVCVASTRPFRALDPAPGASSGRDVNLDGLRTFLALAVFMHHMSIRRAAVLTGVVALPPSHFYAYLGSFGVSVFFMITGYLFWGKLLDRKGKISWIDLYVHRFFRIVPLYWALMAIYITVVLTRADGGLASAIASAWAGALKWLAFGAYPGPPPLLGDTRAMPLVGMTWTLTYEWGFYASLLVTAFLARTRWSGPVLAVAIALTLCTKLGLSGPVSYFISLFLCGMLTAWMARAFPRWRGDGYVRSIIAIGFVIAAVCLSDTAYSGVGVLLLGLFFLLIASGTSLFGLLRCTGAMRLGHASYSIYLLHGVVLCSFFAPSLLGGWAAGSVIRYWCLGAVTTMALVVIASLSYLGIERPGIALGRRLLGRRTDDTGMHGHAPSLVRTRPRPPIPPPETPPA
ncbi:Peptidoglycan/LPS O-acetylase OafA/YrhL, contains acyltransferase and SGNH-hydrolase domains [Dyella jiangningensis]|nr:acyltransferase [Dyella sp. AtDHG13]PXV60872.1 peptidoglycan/LPS O-acetylase OafA/YrhL [Dyella sp. AtDHG13]SDK95016.1 Peptidoglycan/LPS O-acetylase OafA/YrhL, contains acyltransferase and SGNH-hydrolase domains [Dyella jiangningensis]